ncbi:MFS transporter [Dactylosporangium sp. NPDC005555]|uniref:MFS transporter n=1 Tax=Dactylosporangium sp. NPDC005555 TaxID=3154889 RepID=UPI0033B398F1
MRRDRPGRWILFLLGSAFLLLLLDGTIAYVALPSIRQALGFSTGGIHWVMAAYLLAFGGLLLWGGRLAERVGRRRTFVAGFGLFAAAALLCGLASSPGMLVVGRAAQGLAAAIAAPTVLPLLAMTFDDGPGRARALRIWTVIGAAAGTAGLLIGGLILAGPGWRWIFLGSAPVSLALAVAGPFLLRDSPDPTTRRPLGTIAAVTLTGALVLLAVAVTGTATTGWASAHTIVLLLAAAAAFAVYALLSARAAGPPRPVRPGPRLGVIAVLGAAGVAVDGTSLTLALHLQEGLGLTPMDFALTMIAMTGTMVVGSYAGQALAVRLGLRAAAAAGLALIAVGCAVLAVASGVGGVVAGLLALGAGTGTAFIAGQIAVVTAMTGAQSPSSSQIADTSFSAGGAIGLAALSTVLAVRDRAVPAVDPAAGIRDAFVVVLGAAVLAFAAALLLLPRPRARDACAPHDHDAAPRQRSGDPPQYLAGSTETVIVSTTNPARRGAGPVHGGERSSGR